MSGLPPPPSPYGPSHGSSYGPPPYGSSPYGAPYGGVAPGYRPVQSLEGLTLALTIVLGVMAAICFFAFAAYGNRASVMDDIVDSSGSLLFADLDEVEDADSGVVALTTLYMLGVAGTAGVFITWQFRHARNAEAMVGRTGLGTEWAIAGWFIPLGNFVLPGLELYQSSRASDPQAHPQHDPRVPVPGGRGSPLVIVWAIVFGLGTLLFGISRAMWPGDDDLGGGLDRARDAVDADQLAAFSFLVLAAAAVVAIFMVRTVSARQAARLAAQPAAGYGAGVPGPPGAGYPSPPGHAPPPGQRPLGPPPGPPGTAPPGPPGAPGPGTGWPQAPGPF